MDDYIKEDIPYRSDYYGVKERKGYKTCSICGKSFRKNNSKEGYAYHMRNAHQVGKPIRKLDWLPSVEIDKQLAEKIIPEDKMQTEQEIMEDLDNDLDRD